MSKTSNTENAWSETVDNFDNNHMGNTQDNKYGNEGRDDRSYERKEESNYDRNAGYPDNRGDVRKRYDGNEDNMRGRYAEPRHESGRFEQRRRYEPRDYDIRDERSRPSYFERRGGRFDDRKRYDTRRDHYAPRYDDRRPSDFRGGYDEGRYGGSMYNRPAEYGRRVEYGRRLDYGRDGFGGPGYGMMPRRNNFTHRQVTRQDDAPPNLTIGLFNLRRDTKSEDFDNAVDSVLKDKIKTEYTTKIILDRNTGKCRGYGFITFENLDESIKAKSLLDDLIIIGNAVRVAFSVDNTHKNEKVKEEEEEKKPEIEEGELNKEKEEIVESKDD